MEEWKIPMVTGRKSKLKFSIAGVLKSVPLCLDRPAGWSKDPYQRSASHHWPAAALWLPAALWSSRHSTGPIIPLAWPAGGGDSGRRGEGRCTRGQRPERARHAFRVPGQWGRRKDEEMMCFVFVDALSWGQFWLFSGVWPAHRNGRGSG